MKRLSLHFWLTRSKQKQSNIFTNDDPYKYNDT